MPLAADREREREIQVRCKGRLCCHGSSVRGESDCVR
jgi:hypothetical protein